MSEYLNGTYEEGKNAEQDAESESMMDTFLAENVYPEFIKQGIAVSIEPIHDVERQKKGIDAIWRLEDGSEIIVDNKNRASVLNQHSSSLPFEIRTNDRDGKYRYAGWFSALSVEMFGDKVHPTDYIMFIHPYSKDRDVKDFNEITIDEIQALDIILCRVDEVHGYLREYYGLQFEDIYKKVLSFDEEFMKKTQGMTKIPTVLRKCAEGFEKGHCTRINFKTGEEYEVFETIIHTSARSYMKEDPTNLLIREDVIKKLPHSRHFFYSIYKGLFEQNDVKERRPLQNKEYI